METETDEGTVEVVEDPFAEFTSEAYEQGSRIEETSPPAEEPAPQEDEDAEADAPEDEGAEPKKNKTSFRERIDELTRARRQAERERDQLASRLQALERGEVQPPATEPTAVPPAAAPEAGAPNPDDFPYGELDSQYIAAVVRYETTRHIAAFEQARAFEQAQTRAQQEQVQAREQFQRQVEQGREKYPDFEDLVIGGADRGEWALSAELGQLIILSEVGAEIAYHMASNPDEAEQVYRQTPLEQARYFGRLEARFSAAGTAATATGEKPTPTAKAPKAPPPVPPARGAGGRFQAGADTSDFEAFERTAMGDHR